MNTLKHPALFVALAAGALVAGVTAAPAAATIGHSKPGICHPVEGKGETGYGWNLIRPDEASKHIDEATGAGKHTRKDGRTDVYADAAGHCPGWVAPVPTPTATVTPTSTPKPSVTVSPEPSVTPTATVTPSPTPTVTSPAPSPTVTTASPSPSPSVTATTTPAPTVEPSPSITPTTSSTTAPAVARKHATPTGELAQTGAKLNLAAFGLMLTLLGAGLVAFARNLKEGANR